MILYRIIRFTHLPFLKETVVAAVQFNRVGQIEFVLILFVLLDQLKPLKKGKKKEQNHH